jgi:hypothetical protein
VADLIFVVVIIAFFALAALFVVACDHIIGADDSAVTGTRSQAQIEGAVSRSEAGHRQDRALEIGAA